MRSSSSEAVEKLSRKAQWDAKRLIGKRPDIEVIFEEPNSRYLDTWPATQYVHRIRGPVYLDPLYGWIITEDGVLVEESMAPQILDKPAWRNGLPSTRAFQQMRVDPARTVDVDEIVSLRHWWEYNYHHFHLDVLGKLSLLRLAGIPDSTPLALGRYARQLSWADQLLRQGRFGERNFVVPDIDNRMFFRAKSIIYCRTQQGYRERMDYVLDIMQVPIPSPSEGKRRVLLVRRPPGNRLVENGEEVEAAVAEFGFEVIDAADMPISDQIAIFNQTRFLVAMHGAGMTNTIYRRGAPLSVLELHSQSYIPDIMRQISSEYGYEHYRVAGVPRSGDPQHANYVIDPAEVVAMVRQMIADA